MKESHKQARIGVAATGIRFMVEMQLEAGQDSDERIAMFKRDIFKPIKSFTPAEATEVHKKRWQSDFLHRLVEYNLITKHTKNGGGHEGYTVRNLKLLERISDDYFEKSGELLSGLLWPGKATKKAREAMAEAMSATNKPPTPPSSTPMLQRKSKSKAIEKFEGRLEKKVEREKEINDGRDKRSLNKDFVESASLSDVAENIIGFSNVLESLIGIMGDNFTVIMEEIESSGQGELAKKVGGYNKRLDTIEKQMSQLNSSASETNNIVSKLSKQTEDFSQQAIDFSNLVTTLNEAKESDEKLKTDVIRLIESINDDRKDELQKIMSRLSSHVSDGETLREMLLDKLGDSL